MNNSTSINKRVVWIFRLLFLSFVFGSTLSCASFSKTVKNPTTLHKGNVSNINGTYDIVSATSDSIEKVRGFSHWYYQNFFKEIDRKLIKDTITVDSTKKYAFQLKAENHKVLRIDYIVNDSVYRSRLVKTKITKDGYLKLKNKNLQILLVPYLFGGINIKRTRLTLDENDNLLFDVGQHRSAGALIVMFDGRNDRYRRSYRRISNY